MAINNFAKALQLSLSACSELDGYICVRIVEYKVWKTQDKFIHPPFADTSPHSLLPCPLVFARVGVLNQFVFGRSGSGGMLMHVSALPVESSMSASIVNLMVGQCMCVSVKGRGSVGWSGYQSTSVAGGESL